MKRRKTGEENTKYCLKKKSFKLSCIYVVKRRISTVFRKMQVACSFAIDEKSREKLKITKRNSSSENWKSLQLLFVFFCFFFSIKTGTPSLIIKQLYGVRLVKGASTRFQNRLDYRPITDNKITVDNAVV